MKKLLIILILIYNGMNLFAQNYDYGLPQDDLNLLFGYFVPDIETRKRRGSERTFSWGKQTVTVTNGDSVLIDYNIYSNLKFDKEYEKHLLVNDSGMFFLITNIEKLSTNKFKLSLVSMQRWEIWGFKDEGYIVITFLDDVHAVIDNNSTKGFFINHGLFCKTAGPTLDTRQ